MIPLAPLPLSFSGVVVAGGKSSRMGCNKAFVPVDGLPLWQQQYERLGRAGADPRWLSLRSGDRWAPPGLLTVEDNGALGPLGGLFAALQASAASHLIVLAVDLPYLSDRWLQQLRERCASGQGAVGWHASLAAFEPLAAIYPREIFRLVVDAIEAEAYSLQALLQRAVALELMQIEPIQPEQERWLANWNTPAEVEGGLA